jgi:hypothetical protein
METNQRYKKGDIVKVLGLPNAPEMRIEHIDVEKIRNRTKEFIDGVEQEGRPVSCIWFDKNGILYERKFNQRDLFVVIAKPRLLNLYKKDVLVTRSNVEPNFDFDDTY